MEQEKTIFEKIIAGEIPSTKIYEDNTVFAFLDIAPVNIGHTLVIPKKHYRNLLDSDDETVAKVAVAVKKIANAVKEATGADGVNIIQNNEPAAGQVVFHSHVHIVPRFKGDGFQHWHGKRNYNEGEASEVADSIKKAL